MGSGTPIGPCPHCEMLADVREQIYVTNDALDTLREELAPLLAAFHTLLTVPKIAKQLQR